MDDELHDTGWFVYADEPDVRTIARYEPGPNGKATLRVRKQWRNAEAYLKAAADDRQANYGKRWGDGQVIGRMPIGMYFSTGLSEAAKQGDTKHIKRVWNDPDYKYLRTFEGKI
jgi:hypothetical protein